MKRSFILLCAGLTTAALSSYAQPTIIGCPTNITSCNHVVTWTPPAAITASEYYIMNNANYNPGAEFPIGITEVVYTAEDQSGLSSCVFTVNVIGPDVDVASVPMSSIYTGGEPDKLYLGYGGQSVMLAADFGGTSYSWAPATGLSCTNCPTPVFTPTADGNYSFTVSVTYPNGCTMTESATICVANVIAPGNKVYICCNLGSTPQTHAYNPGANAIDVHLSHGDRLGTCSQAQSLTLCGAQAKGIQQNVVVAETDKDLEIAAFPNPFTNAVSLRITSNVFGLADVRIFDLTGRVLETRLDQPVNHDILISKELPAGVYIIEAKAEGVSEKIKVVKVQ